MLKGKMNDNGQEELIIIVDKRRVKRRERKGREEKGRK